MLNPVYVEPHSYKLSQCSMKSPRRRCRARRGSDWVSEAGGVGAIREPKMPSDELREEEDKNGNRMEISVRDVLK